MAGLGSRVCKKKIDYIMGPKGLSSTTWYLNKVRLRTWDHFSVITKIEGRVLRTKKGVKGWAGWAPKSETEENQVSRICSLPTK